MASKKIGDVLLEILADAGVKYIFSIPGDGINDLVEAIRQQDKIRMIQVRHEEAGAFAASAVAKLTGGLAVCMGTSGPGAIHLLNGLYDAKHDHAPVLAISGHVETQYQGTEVHQEIGIRQLFANVSVFNQTVHSGSQLPRLVEEACRAALFRRGVAHLVVPKDIAQEKVAEAKKRSTFIYTKSVQVPHQGDLQRAADLLNKSQKVAILAGIGAKEAAGELVEVAQRLQAPIVKALRGKDILPDEHPLVVGGLGLLGTRPGLDAVMSCDLLLMVGTDFPYYEYYPENTPAIQLDIDGNQIGRRYPIEVGLVGDARPTLAALAPLLQPKEDKAFLEGLQRDMQTWWEKAAIDEEIGLPPIHPQAVAAAISRQASDEAIYCCDTGNVTVWAARHLRIRGTQQFTLSGGLASMGYGLPAAIGAQLTFPDRQVIALVGDGGFAMLMADFLTAVKYELPIAVVVFNNQKLGMIEAEQEVLGHPAFKTSLHNPDFAAFAVNCGGQGEKVTQPDQLETAVGRALASGQPYLLDVMINPDELPFPPEIKIEQALGFAKGKALEMMGSKEDK
jgi:pyruvate oxidase